MRAQALGLWPETGPRAERIAIIGPTFDEVRLVMIEGKSGLLGVHMDDVLGLDGRNEAKSCQSCEEQR